MMSSRYALPVAVLLTLAIIPTVLHSYLDLKTNDGLLTTRINPVLDNFSAEPSTRLPTWGEDTFGSQDWFERLYHDDQGKVIRLFVGRSYDHKRLYHHPDLALSYGKNLTRVGQIRLAGTLAIPVTVLKNQSRPMMAAFALLYDGQFIADPIALQMQDALHALVSPRKAMTLFYIADDNAPEVSDFNKTPAAALLSKAINDFLAQQPLVAK